MNTEHKGVMSFHGWGWPDAQTTGRARTTLAEEGRAGTLTAALVADTGTVVGVWDTRRPVRPRLAWDVSEMRGGMGGRLWLWFLLGHLTDGAGITVPAGSSRAGPLQHEGPQAALPASIVRPPT